MDAGLIRTKKEDKKKRILDNEDSFARTREIASALIDLVLAYKVNLITFEAFSVPKKSSPQNLVKIGFPYAVLATIAAYDDLAAIMMTPQEVKKANCGKAGASKEEVQEVVSKKFAGHPGVEKFLEEVAPSQHNHIWDALGAYVAAGRSDVMRALKIGT
jgi:Holliday junction resolvasome RuvABC endonuclease subunit